MKESWERMVVVTVGILLSLVVAAAIAVPIIVYSTIHHHILVEGVTPDQVEELFAGNPENRVWCHDINLIYVGGEKYLQVVFVTRRFEKDRAIDFLDSVGVDYVFGRSGVR